MGTPGRTFKMIRTTIILLLVSILVQKTLLDDDVVDSLKDAGKQAGDTLKHTGDNIQDKMKDVGKQVGDTVNQIVENTKDKWNEMTSSSSGERGMSLYCGVLLLLVIFF